MCLYLICRWIVCMTTTKNRRRAFVAAHGSQERIFKRSQSFSERAVGTNFLIGEDVQPSQESKKKSHLRATLRVRISPRELPGKKPSKTIALIFRYVCSVPIPVDRSSFCLCVCVCGWKEKFFPFSRVDLHFFDLRRFFVCFRSSFTQKREKIWLAKNSARFLCVCHSRK